MGVIVHDFEVVTDTTPPAEGTEAPGAAAEAAPSSSGMTPEEVRYVVASTEKRCRRLWAH